MLNITFFIGANAESVENSEVVPFKSMAKKIENQLKMEKKNEYTGTQL